MQFENKTNVQFFFIIFFFQFDPFILGLLEIEFNGLFR